MFAIRLSYGFRVPGLVLGCLVIFFTLGLFAVELGRVFSGSTTRGRTDETTTIQYLIYPDTVVGYNGNSQNFKLENRWVWPWSTATLLFTFVFLATGAVGIVSAMRDNYASILCFFMTGILSICLTTFLIAVYATIIAGWKSIYGTSDGAAMPRFPRIDRDLSIVCLVLTCILFLILLVSLILSGKRIDACKRKRFPSANDPYQRAPIPIAPRMPYAVRPRPQRPRPRN